MNTNNNTSVFENKKVNVKIKLALFWVALFFFYIYNDIFSLYQLGHVANLLEGHLEGLHFTQSILFSAGILMSIPSFMILLSLTLNARVNRIVNIVIGIFNILILFGTQFVGDSETWYYWNIIKIWVIKIAEICFFQIVIINLIIRFCIRFY